MNMKTAALVGLACLTLACEDPASVTVQLPATRFSITAGNATIAYSVHNLTQRTVYITACGSRIVPQINRLLGDAWLQYSSMACLANVPMLPIALAPGAVRLDSVSLWEPGTYQILVGLQPEPSGVQPAGYVLSPVFGVQ